MTIATNLGFPRIGKHRELKRALESHWSGKSSADALLGVAKELRAEHWRLQRAAGIEHVPSNDFALYDQVLDTIQLVGATPPRYTALESNPLRAHFAMARGFQADGVDVPAMEMTKWFDTNYHYIVPELFPGMSFRRGSDKPLAELREAAALGVTTRPVLVGPVSLLLLGKMHGAPVVTLLDRLLPVYEELLGALGREGAAWVQLDEPCLVTDLDGAAEAAFRTAYERISKVSGAPRTLLTTYFGALGDNLELATSLPVSGLHVDLVRGREQLEAVCEALPKDRVLSAGVVDGRNVWRADLDDALASLKKIGDARGTEKLFVGPSCSLLHCPVDRSTETELDAELSSWLAFATDKLEEISALARAVDGGALGDAFEKSRAAKASRAASKRVNRPAVAARLESVTADMARRKNPYAARREAQKTLGLPLLPTTTIGSFPQTSEVRAARAEHKAKKRDGASYEKFLREETERAVRRQESLGLDVLVHGEFERNDMVEYFGEQLDGFAFTKNGWVQSYGSRCVKPPIIYGDVARPAPMTVAWSRYAQSLTKLPMKAMLTGPVTILQWSFVRVDQPRSKTCREIALAIRDEVVDLEAAGLRVIQIDEPAIREGLPLRRAEWRAYLDWAVDAFRVASSPVRDDTQIHTHMCYSEFNDIIDAIGAMDADVVSIETSRSRMELLEAFATYRYPNEVGPGVYDIHSPRVPTIDEIVELLARAAKVVPAERLWVNPDCGLKTRGWPEVEAALRNMVEGARRARRELAAGGST
ncbi:MAG: 5-methyltetrahydropteroyltriglutamate--homocysteine S-methyltransferase [Labilithrix sp.]|nr:5-methyltetrahydropteroyltriglutamate--homocysteine S-methyltransferase [Labilithrix sp.]